MCAAEFGGLRRHHRLGYIRLSDGDDRVVRIAMRFRVGSGVVAPGVRLARASRQTRLKGGESGKTTEGATLVSLALVQNRHTDAILAPALYTNLSGAPCVCVFAFACVFVCVFVCACTALYFAIWRERL